MKVLIVYPRMYVYGGGELLVVRLANYLSRTGVPNALLTTEILPEIERDLVDTRLIIADRKAARGGQRFAGPIGAFAALRRQVRENRHFFDVINVHNYPTELCTFPHAKPVVWMCNEPPEVAVDVRLQNASALSWKRFVYKAVLKIERQLVRKYVTAAVVADEFNKSRFERLYGFTPRVVNYGIDGDYFSDRPVWLPQKNESAFTLLHVGMLTPLKNQLTSVQALQSLKETIPEIRLILAGRDEGPYAGTIRAFVRDHGLGDRVSFTGHITRQALRDLFYRSDVLLHPVKSQGGWLSPFEALCAQLPIIVSKEMTASSIIEENGLGIVTDNLCEAIRALFRDQAAHRDRALAASNWIQRHLSWDNFSEKMLSVFDLARSGIGKA